MQWFLYLYLGAMGTIQAPGYFETKAECVEHGQSAMESYRRYHKHSSGFFWCVRAGKHATE